jgi:hypothetical protein
MRWYQMGNIKNQDKKYKNSLLDFVPKETGGAFNLGIIN